MRIVVDTNIVFSAILNTDSVIARIILQPKSKIHFYSTDLLFQELLQHRDKLKKIAKLTDYELDTSTSLITKKIRRIDAELILAKVLIKAENLLKGIDVDDTEFIALTNHIRGKLWSGDKSLQNGLAAKGWRKFISTNELLNFIKQ